MLIQVCVVANSERRIHSDYTIWYELCDRPELPVPTGPQDEHVKCP